MLRYIALVILVALGSVQAADLTGRVVDAETGRPIANVNIRDISTGKVVATNQRGAFVLSDISPQEVRIVASHVAYDTGDTLRVTPGGFLEIRLTPTPWVLNDVVVTGTRSPHLLKDVPVQTEVISRRDFQRSGAKSVDEALESAIGVQINEDVSGLGATIRGIEGDRVLVLIDGERAVGRVRGSIDLGQYSLANVEKIEVVKGTGSTLYGSDAMGGVINIITRRPPTTDRNLSIYADLGTHTSYNPSVLYESGNPRWGYSLDAKFFGTDGFDLDPSTPHTNGVEKTGRFNINGKFRRALSDKWSMVASTRFMRERKEWIEYEEIDALNKYSYDDIETNKRYDGSMVFNYISGDEYSAKMRLFASYYDHDFEKWNDGFWIDTSQTEDLFLEGSYSSNYTVAQNQVVTYGLDYNYQDLKSPSLIEESKADQTWAGYVQYEHRPLKSLDILPGLRYEHHSSFGGFLNPSFNVMFSPQERIKLRGFVGRGFRAPSIKQQYFVFDHLAAGYVVYGGQVGLPEELDLGDGEFDELTQETSINSSISAEFSYGAIGLHRITYFYNDLKDLIEFTLVGFTPEYDRGVYVYQNIERAVTQGIEWESRVRLSETADLSFSYNYLHTRDLVNQRELVNRPKHTGKFSLSYFNNPTGLGATFWGDYHSRKLWVPRSNTGGNEGAPDEYAPERTRLNLNLYRRFDQGLELFLRLENLLDETRYRYGYWPGFSVFGGFKFDWQLKN